MSGKIQARRHKLRWHHKGAKDKVAKARKIKWAVKDRGKHGKTPKGKQWSKNADSPASRKIVGYGIHESPADRLAALRKEIKQRGGGKKGAISTAKSLQMAVNINQRRAVSFLTDDVSIPEFVV